MIIDRPQPDASPAATTPRPRLSLVIPCYNEARNLPLLVTRLKEIFTGDDIEAVLVDNGSTDDTPAVLAEQLAGQSSIRSTRVENNQGYGYGILAGLREARGEILAWTHADMQTDPHDALLGLRMFETSDNPQNLFVKGRRHGRPIADVVFTVGMSVFETVLLRRRMRDINAQPTMFPRAFYERWRDPPHDFSLDLYAYYQALHRGLQVRRFPVHFGDRAHGSSHWNVDWKAKVRFIKRTMDFSLRLRKDLRKPS
ncbi:MAG: glycosyltransferase family 2 protein [Lysobacteraceae bacterium]